MEIDGEMAPHIAALNEKLLEMEQKVLAPMSKIDENTVVSSYTLPQQASLSLACAFSAIMAYHSYKVLNNMPLEEQIELKLQRVQEYVRKLRDIAEHEALRSELGGVAAKKKGAKKEVATSGPKIDKAATRRIVEHNTGKGAKAS